MSAVRRETANILLVLVGGALLKITMNGTYLRYVKPTAKPWVLVAGVVMIVLAVGSIAGDIRAGRAGRRTQDHEQDHDHGHQHGSRSVLLLVLPVLAIFLIAPPALGADSVTRADSRSAVAPVEQASFPPLPAGRAVPIGLSDFITRSVWDSTNSLTDRTVRLTGFVVHDNGALYLARLVISCCAADATPMKVALAGGAAGGAADNQWLEVTGVLRPGSATQANGYTPTVSVVSVTEIPAPADPYEY